MESGEDKTSVAAHCGEPSPYLGLSTRSAVRLTCRFAEGKIDHRSVMHFLGLFSGRKYP
jgi:hypothetical protein